MRFWLIVLSYKIVGVCVRSKLNVIKCYFLNKDITHSIFFLFLFHTINIESPVFIFLLYYSSSVCGTGGGPQGAIILCYSGTGFGLEKKWRQKRNTDTYFEHVKPGTFPWLVFEYCYLIQKIRVAYNWSICISMLIDCPFTFWKHRVLGWVSVINRYQLINCHQSRP